MICGQLRRCYIVCIPTVGVSVIDACVLTDETGVLLVVLLEVLSKRVV